MVPGELGVELTPTFNVLVAEEPQVLFAETIIFPPMELDTVEIVLEVEVPVQPPGRIHV